MRVAAAALLLTLCLLGAAATSDVLDVAAVPEAAPAQHHARQLLQGTAAAPGGYGPQPPMVGYGGSSSRSLLQSAGGYGQQAPIVGYGGPSGRRLAGEDAAPQLEPSDPILQYVQQQAARRDLRQMAEQQAAGGVSASAVAALKHGGQQQARSGKRGSSVVLPAGKCYCRFDGDFNTWALAEQQCKDALYARCQTEEGLQCEWLDRFYAPSGGPGHSLPHERDIATFVFEDCSPQPPCACSGLKFDGRDPVAASVACCRDLRVACKTPYSGLCCRRVESFCSDDAPAPVLSAWTRHVLHHSDCSAYAGLPYHFESLQQMQAAAASNHAAPQQQQQQQQQALSGAEEEAALLKQALLRLEAQVPTVAAGEQLRQRRVVTALAAVAAGAVCVAVVAVAFALRRDEAGVAPITSSSSVAATAAAAPAAADVYAALCKSKRSGSLSAGPPLRRDGSGESCLSRAISIGRLMSQVNSAREPLLQAGSLSRSVSNGSETQSTGSISGDNMP